MSDLRTLISAVETLPGSFRPDLYPKDKWIADASAAMERAADLLAQAERRNGQHTEAYTTVAADNARLRGALEKYGAHDGECDCLLGRKACSCGFDEALAAFPLDPTTEAS